MATRRSGGILLVDRLIDPLSQLHLILNIHELIVQINLTEALTARAGLYYLYSQI